MSIQSSLSPQFTDSLPNVVHRPQQGSGLEINFARRVNNFDTHEGFGIDGKTRSYENPTVNALDAFYRKVADNFHIVRKFVMASNHAHKRGNSDSYLARLGLLYIETMRDFNVCYHCKQPIRVTSAAVVQIPPKYADNPEKVDAIRKANLTRTQKTSVSYPSSVDGSRVKTEFKGVHLRPSKGAVTEVYTDLKPHFEIRKDGKKYTYVFVTWLNNNRVELNVQIVNGKRKYFLDGVELENYTPPKSFRVFTEACKCKADCKMCEKKHSIHRRTACKG